MKTFSLNLLPWISASILAVFANETVLGLKIERGVQPRTAP